MTIPPLRSFPALLLCAFAASGCSLFEPSSTRETLQDLRGLRTEVPGKRDAIGPAADAYERLMDGTGDLVKDHERFGDALDDLKDQRDDMADVQEDVADYREEYNEMWQERLGNIQNAELRQRYTERRDAVSAEFDRLQDASGELNDAFGALIQKFEDVRTALQLDLTQLGLEMVRKEVGTIEYDVEAVRETLDLYGQQFDQLLESMEAGQDAAVVGP